MPDQELPEAVEPSPADVEPSREAGDSDGTDDGSGDDAFAFFSIEGDDFNAPGLPAYAAREVTAFSDAMIAIAKDLWKQRNPDRRKAPGGFERAFDLRLTKVLPGSARPQMILERPTRGVTDEEWAEWEPIFREARDIATAGLAQVDTEDAVPPAMRPKVRQALGKIGGTLKGDARIRVGAPGREAPRATVTPRVHKILKEVPVQPEARERATEVIGVLTEYDGATRSFDLRVDDNRIVKCFIDHFDPDLGERARVHLAVDGVTAPDVRVEGQTRDVEPARHVFNVHSIEVVWTVEQKAVLHRLRSLPGLGAGWLGPGTDAPAAELVLQLEPLVADISALGLPVGIVANSEGSIVLEWRRGDVEFTAAVQSDGQLFMCADDVVTDGLDEREVDFDVELLRRFLTSGAMQ